MIRDAQDVTGLTPAAWRLDPFISKVAAARGIRVPAIDETAEDADPTPAFVNHGKWLAQCPEPICFGQAEDVWRSWPYFLCMLCGNRPIGARWRPVAFPDDMAEIEASLDGLLPHEQNWHPTEPGLGAADHRQRAPRRDPERMTIAERNAETWEYATPTRESEMEGQA